MLGDFISRVVQPWTEARYDRLFTPFAPNGAPAQLLARIFREYEAAQPDEFVPPQHKHFRAEVQRLLGKAADLTLLHDTTLKVVYALYAACFERAETFNFQLAQWRSDPAFRHTLMNARAAVVADRLAHGDEEERRRAHFSRWYEWRAAEVDLKGDTLHDFIKQMAPDDWHEMILRWDWDAGADEINWITAQRTCDRATAVYALCAARPGVVAASLDQGRHRPFVRALAARLENGFYPIAELELRLSMRQRRDFEREIETARATGESPWQLTNDLITHRGRAHAPKYTLEGGQVRYHYDYWLKHIAPRRKR
jgi:hypothetical protein